jgi:hypothetical protein
MAFACITGLELEGEAAGAAYHAAADDPQADYNRPAGFQPAGAFRSLSYRARGAAQAGARSAITANSNSCPTLQTSRSYIVPCALDDFPIRAAYGAELKAFEVRNQVDNLMSQVRAA